MEGPTQDAAIQYNNGHVNGLVFVLQFLFQSNLGGAGCRRSMAGLFFARRRRMRDRQA